MQDRTSDRAPERPSIFSRGEPGFSFSAVSWRRLFGYLKPYTKRMALAILALLVSSGLGLAFPLVIVRLLEAVTHAGDYGPLNILAGALVGIFLLQAIFTFVQSYLLNYVGEHIVYDLRTSLYNHLQRLSLDFYAIRRVGEIVSRTAGSSLRAATTFQTCWRAVAVMRSRSFSRRRSRAASRRMPLSPTSSRSRWSGRSSAMASVAEKRWFQSTRAFS